MIRKSFILFILMLTVFTLGVNAAFLKNVPQELRQPDGTILNCYATGDEFHNWLHDENNFTIIQDPQTGFYVYADVLNGKLVPGASIAGKDDPALSGLTPGNNISREEYQDKKSRRLQFSGNSGFKSSPNQGLMNNLVIFIRFSDQDEYTDQVSYYENTFNGSNMVSLNSYFNEVSDNRLNINSHFFPESSGVRVISYRSDKARSYYKPYNVVTNPNGYSSDNDLANREQALLRDATEHVRQEIEDLDIDLDMDNDGNVDNIVYLIQGKTDGWSDLLWPHKWAMYKHDIYLKGAKVWLYNFQLSEAFSVSVICHEMFHSFGAPDLYRYSDRGIRPVGPWDIMAETSNPPQHMGVYMKMKYGKWVNTIPAINESGTYSLEPVSENPYAAFKILSPRSSSEYFVLEYRKKEGQYESSIPGSGLVIYRVDPSLDGNAEGPPDEIYVFRPNGTNYTNGDLYNGFFSEDSGRIYFGNSSNPKAFLSNGSAAGIRIINIGRAGEEISFEVEIEYGFMPPRNLTSSVSGSDVRLNWQAPLDGEGTLVGFKVFRNSYHLETINNAAARVYNDIDVPDGNYNYWIKAVYTNPDGDSPASNIATAGIGASSMPDLVITDAEVNPALSDPGGLIALSCKLVNNGEAAAGGSTLLVYLSRDEILGGQDVEIANGVFDPLDPGYYYDITGEDILIPEDIGQGVWNVLFVADADKEVEESNEDNNVGITRLTIGSTEFFPPGNLDATVTGNDVKLTWQRPEMGAATISGYSVFRNGSRINEISNPSALSYDDTGLANGSYTFYVTALYSSPAGESYPSNEVRVETGASDLPDLTVTNIEAEPRILDSGGSVTVNCVLRNLGSSVAGSSIMRLYISSDKIVDSRDIELANGTMAEIEAGGHIDVRGENLELPSTISNGSWHLIFVADADEDVAESDEDNNSDCILIGVGESIFNPPEDLQGLVEGNSVKLFWKVPETCQASLTSYRIFRDGEEIQVIEKTRPQPYIDEGLQNKSYSYRITAIYSDPEGESEPSNELLITVSTEIKPDLIVRNSIVSPEYLDPGGVISVSCDIVNTGNHQAGYSQVVLYISRDETLDVNDEVLAFGTIGPIAPGMYREISGEDLYIPQYLLPGEWHIFFTADAYREVNELDEENNHEIVQIGIASKRPDLVITNIYLIRDHVSPGGMMRTTVFLYNSGYGEAGETKLSYYLSDDDQLDQGDIYLNEIDIDPMSAEEQLFRNKYIRIPENTEYGNYYLIAFADGKQSIAETNESNNIFAVPVSVGVSGIDDLDLSEGFLVYPTLAHDRLYLSYEGPQKGKIDLKFFDQLGREVFSKAMISEGFVSESIDVSSWKKGFYYVNFVIGERSFVSNFIKH